MRLRFLILVLALVAWPSDSSAQSEETRTPEWGFHVSGRIQARASVGINRMAPENSYRLGVGIKRLRLVARATLGDRVGFQVQLDGSGGTASVLDAFATYQISERLRFRAGRMVSAQPRALILTGLPYIDTAERAAIAERWNAATLGSSGRDFGIDFRYQVSQAELLLFVHNGDGDWSRNRGNYKNSITGGNATGDVERTNLAVSGAITLKPSALPGVELGGFAGYNPNENPATERLGQGRRYATYGAHAYWGAVPGSQRLRLKADAVGITYEALAGQDTQQSMGLAILIAGGISQGVELFVRGEALEVDTNGGDDADGYFTTGLNFSPSARRGQAFHQERVTLAWSRFTGGVRGSQPEDMVVLQLQLTF